MTRSWRESRNIRSAIIAGAFVVAAVIGGYFHWCGSSPQPSPQPRTTQLVYRDPGPIVLRRHAYEPFTEMKPSEPIQTTSVSNSRPSSNVRQLLTDSPIGLGDWLAMVFETYPTLDDRKRAFRDYIGTQVTWEGYFEQYNRSIHDPSPGNTYFLKLLSRHPYTTPNLLLGRPFVRCWFSAAAKNQLDVLKPGQRIVIRGTLANAEPLGTLLCTDLNQCEIIAAEDDRIATGSSEAMQR